MFCLSFCLLLGLRFGLADEVMFRLGPNLVRVLPSTCVTFLVYENMKFYLPRMWHDEHDDEILEAVE